MGNRISSREGFVSDNLVNLGKRLQINYDLKEAVAAEDPAEQASAPRVGTAAAPAEREKLAARHVVAERSEAERMYRELRDRIANSVAATRAEMERLAAVQAELDDFRRFLDEAARELDDLDPDSATVIRDIEDIRFRYFTASGRAQGFSGAFGAARNDPAVAAAAEESKSFGTLLYESLPVVLAILFGALIVGTAFVIALM